MTEISRITYADPAAIDALFALRREKGLSGRAFMVGVALINFIGGDRDEGWAARSTLAAMVGTDERHVSRAIRELESLSFISTRYQHGKPNQYILTPGQNGTGTGAKSAKGTGAKSAKGAGAKSAKGAGAKSAKGAEGTGADMALDLVPFQPPNTRHKGERAGSDVFAEYAEIRTSFGMSAPIPGKRNFVNAVKFMTLVPDAAERREILTAFFDMDDDWLRKKGYQFWQLVDHRLDECRAVANGDTQERPIATEYEEKFRPDIERLGAEFIADELREIEERKAAQRLGK